MQSYSLKLKIFYSLVVVFSFSFLAFNFSEAAGASLKILPQIGTFTEGSTFEVSVFVNTGGDDVNVVKVDLKFDPEKLRVITPAKEISIVGEWIFPPSFSNKKGTTPTAKPMWFLWS